MGARNSKYLSKKRNENTVRKDHEKQNIVQNDDCREPISMLRARKWLNVTCLKL